MPLQNALQTYEKALDALEKLEGVESQIQQSKVLSVLVARDAAQHLVEEAPAVAAEQLMQLSQLDDRLKAQKNHIVRVLDLNHWRSLLKPPETAWWWYLDPPALFPFLEASYPWLERLDWVWAFASLFFLTFAVTVVIDTLNRVVGEGLSTEGLLPFVVQVLLTIAGGSAALTASGRQVLRSMMTRVRIPKHYWQEFSALASLVVLLVVLGIHEFYLPYLANHRYEAGQAHYEVEQFDSALQAYQQSIALRPDFVEAHYSLGLIYEDLQRTEEAIAEYQLVVSEDSGTLDRLTWLRAHNNLGRLYILDEQYRTAWIPLERAFTSINQDELTDAAMQIEYYNLLKNLGWMWLEQGQFIEADEFLNAAITQNPQRSAAHCLKAQALEGLEQEEGAIAAWGGCLAGKRQPQAEEANWAAMARERLEGGQ